MIIRNSLLTASKVSQYSSSPSPKSEGSNTEQSFTTPPILKYKGEVETENLSQFSMEFQMTIQTSVEQLTKKQASMLLCILNSDVIKGGIGFTEYLTMEFLFNFLLRSHDPIEERFVQTRRTLLVSELILSSTKGEWITLGEREKLPDEVLGELFSTEWLPNERTVQSWRQHFNVQKFLRVRIVRLDSFEKSERNSVRYSSYTKGYGEGGKLSTVLKTPFSFELDGDETERPSVVLELQEISKYNQILLQIQKWKSIKRNRLQS